MRRVVSLPICLLAVLISLCFVSVPAAQAENARPVLITQNVDESKLVTLGGNTRPEANAKNDRGLVADGLAMEHMLLQLQRSPEQERELRQLIDDLHNSSSPDFHRWLSAKEFGERYGLAQQDLDTVTRWLQSHGFKVNVVYENGLLIDFSGTVGQVREAFHTEIHQLNVKGVKHFANMSDPKVPAALAPAITGVVSLHNFMPHTMFRSKADYTGVVDGTTYYMVTPADLATIYNYNPVFTAGISGAGQTVVVIEDTNVFNPADWTTFRKTFGLSSYTSGSFTQVHPASSGTNNCSNPGVNDAEGEAILDAEYASASAPSAAIELASCADTTTTFGGLIALQNLLNESGTPPAVVSVSYGECEAYTGATANAAFSTAYQQAVTEGVSVFVAAGDSGAGLCTPDYYYSETGIGVSGWASTPYNVAVGGTDFGDTYAKVNSTYWNSTNTSTYESAKSYVPEIPWNDSCASVLLATYAGYSETYGTSGFCNSTEGANYMNDAAGSGGPSGCATGSPSVDGVVGGTCKGWPKPSWQSLVGNPNDTVRDLPDVSLFAANGLWLHFYPYCDSDQGECSGAPDAWAGAGGTSFASPIMAGIQALINQKAGERQGNPNPTYYSLAASEYGASGDSSCNSTLGNAVSSSCIFYDVTQGDMDVPCIDGYDCYAPSGDYGVLSTSTKAYDLAYGTTTGWDFATGIGTVNVANLVNNWPGGTANFTLSAAPNTLTVTQGSNGTSTITVTPLNGFTGSVTLSATGLPSGVTAGFSPNPTSTTSTLTLTANSTATTGTSTVTIGGTSGSLSNQTTIQLTVSASGSGAAVTLTPTSLTFPRTVVGAKSAAKTITVTDSGTATLTISSIKASGDFAISSSTCGSTLAVGKTCKVSVAFTPTAVGTRSGAITFTDNAANSPQNAALTGTGTAAATLTPASATFAATKVGSTSAAKTFTLANKQSETLTSISIAVSGDFSKSATTCSSSLAAKSSCTISVVFKPTATGSRTGTLSVSDSAAGSPQTSSLSGTGK
jgi:hypothetical protein